MPILSNPRHEKFAQALANGKSATEAYVNAGFRASRQNAARLRTKDDISARVLEIQRTAAQSAEITLAGVLRELDQAISIATAKGQPNALVNAAALRAKLGGLMVDKSQVELNATINDPALECATTAELCRKLADERLDSLSNSRWLPITEQDRQHLADLFAGWSDAIEEFVREVNRRPLVKGAYLMINGKAEHSS